MNNRDIALEFLRCFCAVDLAGLAPLLAKDLRLRGPLYRFDSRDSYLDSLKDDPPEECTYRVLSVTESKDCVSLYYDYDKRDRTITIAQLFRFENQRICEMLLVFDSK